MFPLSKDVNEKFLLIQKVNQFLEYKRSDAIFVDYKALNNILSQYENLI